MFTQPTPAACRRRPVALALLLALGAPLAAHAGSTCLTNPATNPVASSGNASLACGDGSQALGDFSSAFGYDATAGINDTTDPDGPTLHGTYAFAAGAGAQALGDNDIALGSGSYAEGRDTPSNSRNDTNTAIGHRANASGGDSLALGENSMTEAPSADNSTHAGQYSLAFGQAAYAGNANAVAFGSAANASGRFAIDIGQYNSFATGEDSVVIGDSANGSGDGATNILGFGAAANAVAIDNGNETGTFGINILGSATADQSISIGDQSGTGGSTNAIVIGFRAGTSGSGSEAANAVVLGNDAGAAAVDGAVLGYFTGVDAAATAGTAAGQQAGVAGEDGSALGSYAYAGQAQDTSVGYDNQAIGGLAAGTQTAAGQGSVALGGWAGDEANADTTTSVGGNESVALGDDAQSQADHITLLGSATSEATNGDDAINGVALGYGSVIDRTPTSVSVGNAAALRQITNVAAATTDTDAINVSQMNAAVAGISGGGGFDEATAEAYMDKGDATTLASAQQHADAGDAANHAYVDTQLKQALATANQYADANDKATLDAANAYTDSRLAGLGQSGLQEFQQQVDARFHDQDKKLNRTGAIGAAMAGMVAVAGAANARRTRLGVALGAYHDQTAFAIGVQHAFTPKLDLTLAAGLAKGDSAVSISLGTAL